MDKRVVAAILAGAIASTVALWSAARIRIDDNSTQAGTVQRLRLQRVSARIDDFTADAAQLVSVAANQTCTVRGDRQLVKRLLRGLLASRLNSRIYGVGCFFEPGVFDARTKFFGPYAQTMRGRIQFQANSDGTYDYLRLPWYRAAVSTGGALTPFGPYVDANNQFISFLKAFYVRGHLAGVASVDARGQSFTSALSQGLRRGDRVSIRNHAGVLVLAVGTLPPAGVAVDMWAPISFTRAHLHYTADSSAVVARTRRILWNAGFVTALIWGIALILAYLFLRNARSRQQAVRMQAEQTRLQDEIALRQEVETHLREVAFVDTLTGLPNRTFILDRLGNQPQNAAAFLILIDMDAFALVNDTLGHESGDRMLRTIGRRLRSAFGRERVARLGGDEFAILGSSVAADAQSFVQHAAAVFEAPVRIQGRDIHCTASLGIVIIDGVHANGDDVLRDAEIAMYSGKRQARGSFTFFSDTMRRQVERDAILEHDLRGAIAQNDFEVYYQPVVDLKSGAVVSLEALARWRRGTGGIALPADFIPYAENHGLISAIDSLILTRVCSEMLQFVSIAPELSVAVNCSMAQLTSHDIVAFTLGLLQRYHIPPTHLRLEITETSVMRNAEYALESMQKLRALGVLTVVDDFGTGYSSLAYLQRLPISGVKIDRSFITPLGDSVQAIAIVRSIIALAETLGLYTVAEGVETAEQLAILLELGATFGQGYFFSRPVPPHEVEHLLAKSYLAAS